MLKIITKLRLSWSKDHQKYVKLNPKKHKRCDYIKYIKALVLTAFTLLYFLKNIYVAQVAFNENDMHSSKTEKSMNTNYSAFLMNEVDATANEKTKIAASAIRCQEYKNNCTLYCSDGSVSFIDYNLESLQSKCPNKLLNLMLTKCEFNYGTLQNSFFYGDFNLQYLSINQCNLQVIEAKAFQQINVKNLHTLILINNQLTTLQDNTFEGLINLQNFVFMQTPLSLPFKGSQFLKPFSKLKAATIQPKQNDSNLMEPWQWWQNLQMSYVTTLDIGNTNLKDILNDKTFEPFVNLERLILFNCNLSSIKANVFNFITHSFKYLDLRSNHLQTLDYEFLQKLAIPSIQVNLSLNEWHCECNTKMVEYFAEHYERIADEILCYTPQKWQQMELKWIIEECKGSVSGNTTAAITTATKAVTTVATIAATTAFAATTNIVATTPTITAATEAHTATTKVTTTAASITAKATHSAATTAGRTTVNTAATTTVTTAISKPFITVATTEAHTAANKIANSTASITAHSAATIESTIMQKFSTLKTSSETSNYISTSPKPLTTTSTVRATSYPSTFTSTLLTTNSIVPNNSLNSKPTTSRFNTTIPYDPLTSTIATDISTKVNYTTLMCSLNKENKDRYAKNFIHSKFEFSLHLTSSTSLIIKIRIPLADFVMIYFTNPASYRMETSIKPHKAVNEIIDFYVKDLKPSTAYLFCLMESNAETLSPFDCQAQFMTADKVVTAQENWIIAAHVVGAVFVFVFTMFMVYLLLHYNSKRFLKHQKKISVTTDTTELSQGTNSSPACATQFSSSICSKSSCSSNSSSLYQTSSIYLSPLPPLPNIHNISIMPDSHYTCVPAAFTATKSFGCNNKLISPCGTTDRPKITENSLNMDYLDLKENYNEYQTVDAYEYESIYSEPGM